MQTFRNVLSGLIFLAFLVLVGLIATAKTPQQMAEERIAAKAAKTPSDAECYLSASERKLPPEKQAFLIQLSKDLDNIARESNGLITSDRVGEVEVYKDKSKIIPGCKY